MYCKKNINISVLIGILFLVACSPTKDKWLNRNFHTLTGHYNVYFNGEQKLLDAITQIEAGHVNDFTKILDVFPMGTADNAKAAGNVLDEAIKKFSKSIQLHTIGKYTDDSYYSIGKCRYYKQDYFASIETFQYVIGTYKNGEYSNASACWIARNYIGMKKTGEAEALMGLLLAKKDFEKKDVALIYATAADINIKQEKYASAIDNLNTALKGKVTKDKKIRYHFILGQLCMLSNKNPEASYHFNKVVSYLPPYEYAFNANINLTRIYDLKDPRSVEKVKRNLRKMAKDDKNIDYLDQIYFEIGKLSLVQKNYPDAVSNFKKSLFYSKTNRNQKGLTYYELAKLYFDRKDFKNAQAYYDSTVQFMDHSNKQFKQIEDTKLVLSELIINLTTYETEDSLQHLAMLSNDALERKVDRWIAEDKRQKDLAAKEAKKKAKMASSEANNQNVVPAAGNIIPGSGSNAWYFYNPALVNSGAAEFYSNKKWGKRINEDYWRIAAKEKIRTEPTATSVDTSNSPDLKKDQNGSGAKEIPVEPVEKTFSGNETKDSWVKNVPFTSKQKKASNEKMLEALHNLGVIYYDRLHNPAESRKYFDILQNRFPVSEYEPAAFYYLFKSNNDLKNQKVAEDNKKSLITNYPDNYYALLVQNKSVQSAESANDKVLLESYEKMYNAYHSGNYAEAMRLKSAMEKQFPGNQLSPKMDLLYAFCIGKTQDRESYRKALTQVSNTHKGMDVAQTADECLAAMNKQEKKAAIVGKDSTLGELDFETETETPFYYVLVIKDKKYDLNEFIAQFTAFNEAYSSENNLRVNAIQSNEGFQLITIREFPEYKSASNYIKTLASTDFKNKKLSYSENTPEYLISTKNFRKVLKENKVEKFAEFYKKQEELINSKK